MYKKLLQDLAASPSTIHSILSAEHRLLRHKQLSGLLIIALLAVIAWQLFALYTPTNVEQPPHRNAIVPGGVASKEHLVSLCQNNAYQIQSILTHFKSDCSVIQQEDFNGKQAISQGKSVWLLSRSPTTEPTTQGFNGNHAVSIAGVMYYLQDQAHNILTDSPYFSVSTAQGNLYIEQMTGNLFLPDRAISSHQAVLAYTNNSAGVDFCSANPNQCLDYSIRAIDIDERTELPPESPVAAGQRIRYELTVTNTQTTGTLVQPQMSIGNVIDHMHITNLSGAHITDNYHVTWPFSYLASEQALTFYIDASVRAGSTSALQSLQQSNQSSQHTNMTVRSADQNLTLTLANAGNHPFQLSGYAGFLNKTMLPNSVVVSVLFLLAVSCIVWITSRSQLRKLRAIKLHYR